MSKYDVIITGGGLGGLETALVLSKEGMNVCVLERCKQAGGLLQSFRRHDKVLDTSIHYVGSMDKGEALDRYFRYFGIADEIDAVRLDQNSYDNVILEDSKYSFPMGIDNFEEYLMSEFPSERRVIPVFCRYVREAGMLSDLENLKNGLFNMDYMDYYTVSASDIIRNNIKDPRLFDALWGTSLLYAGIEKITPFYIHAITLYSNLKGAYRFRGGTKSITDALVRRIEENGGTVMRGMEVTRIVAGNDGTEGVMTSDGSFFESDSVISDIHPVETFRILDKSAKLKPSFISRITSEDNTYGLFCLYLTMKPGCFRYVNQNFFIRKGNKRVNYVLLSMQPPANGGAFAEVVTIVTPMSYSAIERWSETKVGNRGDDYLDFKESMSEEILDFVSNDFPDIKSSIEHKYSATPLTFRDYTKTPQGSAYGIQKNCNKPYSTFIAGRTKLPGLYLTGQNINVHGVLGVTITSLLTCADLLGSDYIINKIKEKA
ncbi:MAG: NAD(P)/FAD-dependent oxidoreductase [Rikenellaceae bacterium]|nr:NAD(P)/FAD-dependent oxidoreductase [Rikenellaceae bacterium]